MVCVRLTNEFKGLRSTCRLYSKQMNLNPKRLGDLYTDSKVFIACKQHNVSYSTVPGQFDHVSDNQGIDTLLFSNTVY